jgi:hypothetical protein
LVAWLHHLLRKSWKHMTTKRMARLIEALDRHFGWDIHRIRRSVGRCRSVRHLTKRPEGSLKARYR